MAQAGIHYVVGPNVDDGAAAVRPVAEQNGIIYFPYAFPKELYTAPASNAILGMVANYQSGPAIYKYLMENNGVKKVAFVAANPGATSTEVAEGINEPAENTSAALSKLHQSGTLTRQRRGRPREALASYETADRLKPGDPRSGLLPLLQDHTPGPIGSADAATWESFFQKHFRLAESFACFANYAIVVTQ